MNQPNDKIGLFALGTILNYVEALDIEPSLWNPTMDKQATDIVVFDDFYTKENKLNFNTLQKYGVNFDPSTKLDDNAPHCFTARDVKNGTIVRALNLIDIKLDEKHMRDCVVRDIGYSFGLNLDFLKNLQPQQMSEFDEFSRDAGPFLAKKREECTPQGREVFEYTCLSEK